MIDEVSRIQYSTAYLQCRPILFKNEIFVKLSQKENGSYLYHSAADIYCSNHQAFKGRSLMVKICPKASISKEMRRKSTLKMPSCQVTITYSAHSSRLLVTRFNLRQYPPQNLPKPHSYHWQPNAVPSPDDIGPNASDSLQPDPSILVNQSHVGQQSLHPLPTTG